MQSTRSRLCTCAALLVLCINAHALAQRRSDVFQVVVAGTLNQQVR